MRASVSLPRTARPLGTMVGRVALIDADARIPLAMQACRALMSALLKVVGSERLGSLDRGACFES
jgi:hypothetical protein